MQLIAYCGSGSSAVLQYSIAETVDTAQLCVAHSLSRQSHQQVEVALEQVMDDMFSYAATCVSS